MVGKGVIAGTGTLNSLELLKDAAALLLLCVLLVLCAQLCCHLSQGCSRQEGMMLLGLLWVVSSEGAVHAELLLHWLTGAVFCHLLKYRPALGVATATGYLLICIS